MILVYTIYGLYDLEKGKKKKKGFNTIFEKLESRKLDLRTP